MALVVADRVKETTSTTGTGDLSLGGAPANFIAFSSALSDGDTTYYAIVDNTNVDYEVGVGTYTSSTNSLSRDTVFESSNSNAKVDFQAGSKDVFITYPASKSVLLDASGEVLGNQTFSGSVTLNADPTSALQAATKQYVDDTAAEGIQYHSPVRVEQEGNLTATYNNGTAGVGATLTNAGTQAALVIDGITMVVNDRVLVYEQTDATQNGIYDVTNIGSASTNWVLTRSADADSYAPSDPNALAQGSGFFVQEGTLGAGEKYVCNTVGTITFWTTDITFVQVATAQIYTGGTGISITGSEISSDITLAEVTANGATTTSNVTFGNITGNTLVSNSITYPTSDGSTGQFIKTDGAGTLSFATALTATPTLDAVTTTGNNTANSITVGNINASDVSCNALTSTGIDDNATSTAITIDASERVGIGITSMNANLEVAGTGTTSEDVIHWSNSSGVNKGMLQLSSTGGGQLQLRDAGNTVDVQISSTTDSYFNGGNVGIGVVSPRTGYRVDIQESADNGVNIQAGNAASDIALAVGSASTADKVVIQAGGNVGIGTASPTFTTGSGLEIQRTSATATLRLEYTGANGYELSAESGQVTYNSVSSLPHVFEIGSTERMRIDSSGSVGIGTTSPNALLHVSSSGNGEIEVERVSGALINLQAQSAVGVIGTDSNHDLRFKANGSVRASITTAGHVGIGTTSPYLSSWGTSSKQLTVSGPTYGTLNLWGNTTRYTIGSGAGYLYFWDETNSAHRMRLNSSGFFGITSGDPLRPFYVEKSNDGDWVAEIYNTHATNGYGLKVRAGDDSSVHSFYVTDVSNTGLFTVRGHGYVGIGNTNPQRKLSVHESAASTGCWSQFTNAQTGTSSGAGTLVGIDSSQDFRILNYENTRLRFYTNATDRMQINANGTINAESNTGSSYLMTLTNSGTSAGQGQVLELDASGRSTGTRDINIFNIRNADGIIHGVRNDGQTYVQATSSSAIRAKTTNYTTNFGVLPWSASITYLSSGVYYDNASWVHASGDAKSTLLGLSGDGVTWYASSNSSASWNQASNVQLWNAAGTWTSAVNTGNNVSTGTLSVLSSASTNTILAGTGSSTYVAYRSNSTTTRGYVGNGPGLLTGSANSDFIVRSQANLKFGVSGNNLGATLTTNGLTVAGDITGDSVFGDFMRISRASGTSIDLRDTDATNATNANIYMYFTKADGGSLGYVGYGSGATNYLYLNNQQGDISINTISGGTIRLANNTNCSGWFTSSNLVRNYSTYGSVAIRETRGGYYGLSLNNHAIFMSSGTNHGIYDGDNNDWWVRFYENAGVDLRYNSATKLVTTSTGVDITGEMQSDTLRVTGNSRVDGNLDVATYIRHVGDTDTYIRFVAADDLQLVAGGRQMLRMDEGANPDVLEFVVGTTYTDSSGNIVASGNVTAYASDKRLKTNIKPIENALDKVMSIKGVHYDWIDDVENLGFHPDRKIDNIGVIAQEVEEVLPQIVKAAPFDQHRSADTNWEFVSKSGEDYKTVDYDKLTALLIEAVKDLKAEVDELKRAAA